MFLGSVCCGTEPLVSCECDFRANRVVWTGGPATIAIVVGYVENCAE